MELNSRAPQGMDLVMEATIHVPCLQPGCNKVYDNGIMLLRVCCNLVTTVALIHVHTCMVADDTDYFSRLHTHTHIQRVYIIVCM